MGSDSISPKINTGTNIGSTQAGTARGVLNGLIEKKEPVD